MGEQPLVRMRIALSMSLFVSAAAASSAVPDNKVPILVYWTNSESPRQVLFEDRRTGTHPFVHRRDHFEGRRPDRGTWATHDVTVVYARGVLPLALRTLHNQSNLRLVIQRPPVPRCTQSNVRSLVSARPAQPMAGLSHILAVRQLLVMDPSCPTDAKRILSRYYFEFSCSLAKKYTFLLVPEEAKRLFIDSKRNDSEEARFSEEVNQCDTELQDMVAQ